MRLHITIAVALSCSLFALAPAQADNAQAGGAPPQAGSWQPPQAPQPEIGSANEVICKDIKVSGSRLRTDRVCMTRLDWEQSAKQAKDTTNEFQRNGQPQIVH